MRSVETLGLSQVFPFGFWLRKEVLSQLPDTEPTNPMWSASFEANHLERLFLLTRAILENLGDFPCLADMMMAFMDLGLPTHTGSNCTNYSPPLQMLPCLFSYEASFRQTHQPIRAYPSSTALSKSHSARRCSLLESRWMRTRSQLPRFTAIYCGVTRWPR